MCFDCCRALTDCFRSRSYHRPNQISEGEQFLAKNQFDISTINHIRNDQTPLLQLVRLTCTDIQKKKILDDLINLGLNQNEFAIHLQDYDRTHPGALDHILNYFAIFEFNGIFPFLLEPITRISDPEHQARLIRTIATQYLNHFKGSELHQLIQAFPPNQNRDSFLHDLIMQVDDNPNESMMQCIVAIVHFIEDADLKKETIRILNEECMLTPYQKGQLINLTRDQNIHDQIRYQTDPIICRLL